MDQNRADTYLYPPIAPFDQRMVDVSGGHQIYLEQSGNPDGIPLLILHGGPGGGSSPTLRRFANPTLFRIICFDQRGCGKSKPFASVVNNTTWDLVADIEQIRTQLGVDRWAVFGGSWGATLALIYAQAHPAHTTHLVLRGVFTGTRAELDWFYGGAAALFWPDAWARFVDGIPADEHGDMIAAYHKRLFSGDMRAELKFARQWAAWENALASIESDGYGGEPGCDYARAFARLENHYFMHGCFLSDDQQILPNMRKIAHIPGVIVQGRYDMICPPKTAYDLAQVWPNARLRMIKHAGHAISEPGIARALVDATDQIAQSDKAANGGFSLARISLS